MLLFAIILTVLLSVCATAILSYISMAVMIGPWIESTIVLLASIFFGIFMRRLAISTKNEGIALVTSGASIGGILATACGFSFPTLFFLDKDLFNSWLQSPLYFSAIMASLSLTAAALGMLIANLFEKRLLIVEKMEFPIGQMVYRMISAQNQLKQSVELGIGFLLTIVYGILQVLSGLIPRCFVLIESFKLFYFNIPLFKIPMLELPMLWSIGFVTGHIIAKPLLIGIISKILLINPLHTYYFSELKFEEFSLAFGTGMVLYGTLLSMLELPRIIINFIKNNFLLIFGLSIENDNINLLQRTKLFWAEVSLFMWILVLSAISAFLFYFKFTLCSQLYLIFFTIICTYQLLIIGGNMGIAPLGRFATLVLMPGMFIFGFDSIQIMLVSTFVEISGGVGVDILFSRKMALLSGIDRKKVMVFQWLGIVVSSLSVGLIFWVLITKLGLGTEQLLAQKALNRAMIFNITTFNFFALTCGALFGSLLKDFKVNPMLVLGGILMSQDYSLVLALGALSTYFVKEKQDYYPFWSGVFAANSLWMVIRALL